MPMFSALVYLQCMASEKLKKKIQVVNFEFESVLNVVRLYSILCIHFY